ncbi:MAG: TRAP transporter substrate-binding protein [Arenicella sp.]
MKNNNKKIIIGLLLSLICGTAMAQTWDMPTPYGDGNHPTQIALEFAKEVEERTNGQFTINVHSGGSLIKHPEIPRSVKTGRVSIGEIFIGRMGNTHPIFKVDNIPFLATDYDAAEKLYSVSKVELEKQLAKENMLLLYTVAWPAQSLYAKKEINSLEDVRGIKMRAYSPTTSRLADLMGSLPVNVPFGEIAQAFSTNLIDAMITSPSTGVNGKSWDYSSHYSDIKAWIPKNMVVVNRKAFEKLGEQEQKALLGAAANAQAKGWKIVRQKANEHTEILRKNGMQVSRPSLDLLEELRGIGHTMTQEWVKETGQVGDEIIGLFRQCG